MQILYFAWLRQRTGLAEETVSPPPEVTTVGGLMTWLAARGPGHAAAFADPRQVRAALDQDLCGPDTPLGTAREVAFFPPSRAVEMPSVSVQAEPFDIGAEIAALAGTRTDIGAIASFSGLCRADDKLASMTLEHWPGVTERAIASIVDQALARWPLTGCRVIHRYGPMRPGDGIVLVLAASAHRAAALEATAFLMDWLKTKAPFWKREDFADGTHRWVEARAEDDTAAARWAPG